MRPLALPLYLGLMTNFALMNPRAHALDLDFSQKTPQRHVTFADIPPTKYEPLSPHHLRSEVASSASVLLYPLSTPFELKAVSFAWRTQGTIKTKSASHEESRVGDDFYLRIGLCLAGKKPLIPFFVPRWIKLVERTLIHPTDRLIYLVVGSKHQPTQKWSSPYGDSMEHIALQSKSVEDGWQEAEYRAPSVLKVVGIWIMSDGDNTQSQFSTEVKNLRLFK